MRPDLCRAARALLGISQATLAKRAGCALATVVAYEGDIHGHHNGTIVRIREALESQGAFFRSDGSVTTCEQILAHWATLKTPTSTETAEAVIAADRKARGGAE
jgi:transcriptional regulator with XRE-family HTH domain